MVKHVVFFQLADSAEGKSKQENAHIIKQNLENLISKIDILKRIEVGINIPNQPNSNYDICLICEFDKMEDVSVYNLHPEHQKVAQYIGKCKTSRAAVDYEL